MDLSKNNLYCCSLLSILISMFIFVTPSHADFDMDVDGDGKCKCFPQTNELQTCEVVSQTECLKAKKEDECKPDKPDEIPECRVECENRKTGVSYRVDQPCAWEPSDGKSPEMALSLGDGAVVTVSIEDLKYLQGIYPGVTLSGSELPDFITQEILGNTD